MLSHMEIEMIRRLTEAIFPGAVEARACDFIIRDMKSNPFLEDLYRNGLQRIDQGAMQLYHTALLNIDEKRLNHLLRQYENDAFFKFLRNHTLEGVFSDPIYGGNYQAYGWRLVGFAGPRFYPPETLDEPQHPTVYYSLDGIAYEEKK